MSVITIGTAGRGACELQATVDERPERYASKSAPPVAVRVSLAVARRALDLDEQTLDHIAAETLAHDADRGLPRVAAGLHRQVCGGRVRELNGAFRAQLIHCSDFLRIDPARRNVNGGGRSVSHPYGMTDAGSSATR